jgi:hypothetical protein
VPGDEHAFIDAACALVQAPAAALASMREQALAAAHRATWPEIMARFEAGLENTVHAFETTSAHAAVVA